MEPLCIHYLCNSGAIHTMLHLFQSTLSNKNAITWHSKSHHHNKADARGEMSLQVFSDSWCKYFYPLVTFALCKKYSFYGTDFYATFHLRFLVIHHAPVSQQWTKPSARQSYSSWRWNWRFTSHGGLLRSVAAFVPSSTWCCSASASAPVSICRRHTPWRRRTWGGLFVILSTRWLHSWDSSREQQGN